MKRFLLAIVGALASGTYWWLVTTIGFGLFGGDYAPNTPPQSAATQTVQTVALIVVAVILYAVLSLQWRKFEARIAG